VNRISTRHNKAQSTKQSVVYEDNHCPTSWRILMRASRSCGGSSGESGYMSAQWAVSATYHSIIMIITHTCQFKSRPLRWTLVSRFDFSLHTSSLTPSNHVLLGQEHRIAVKEEEWRESTFHEVQLAQKFCRRMPFLLPASDKDIHWNSSFLQPPTDSWGERRRSILRLLSDVSAPMSSSSAAVHSHCNDQKTLYDA